MDSSTPPQYPYAPLPQATYSYAPAPPEAAIIPAPGSKMAKYKTSLWKHFEQTGTCQMEHRWHFAHGKHELRKQTDALPTNITDLYQSPTNTTAPPGYVHNKYKTVPCK